MSNQRYTSIWDAIENTTKEAVNMKMRSDLMMALNNHLASSKMSQTEAEKLFQVNQQHISDLISGKIHLFSLDELVNMASAAGLCSKIKVFE